MLRQLTKRRKSGELYQRRAPVERLLETLLDLDRETLSSRIDILDRSHPDFIPPECLVYMVREATRDNRDTWFNRLCRALIKRCALTVGHKVSGSAFRDAETVREEIIGEFCMRLSRGIAAGSDLLDAYEVAFDQALAGLRIEIVRKERRRENRQPSFNPIPSEESDDPDRWVLSLRAEDGSEVVGLWGAEYEIFRKTVFDAIERLPPLERDAILLRLDGWPIQAEEPDMSSIARKFGVDEGTIRYRIKQGVKKVVVMTQGTER